MFSCLEKPKKETIELFGFLGSRVHFKNFFYKDFFEQDFFPQSWVGEGTKLHCCPAAVQLNKQPKVLFAQNLLLTLATAPLLTALVLTYTTVTHGINVVPVLEILDSVSSTKETDVLSADAAVLKYWRNISVPLAASPGT